MIACDNAEFISEQIYLSIPEVEDKQTFFQYQMILWEYRDSARDYRRLSIAMMWVSGLSFLMAVLALILH